MRVTRALVPPTSTAAPYGPSQRRWVLAGVPAVVTFALVLGACGGGDDDEETATATATESSLTAAPLTNAPLLTNPATLAPTATIPPTPPSVVYVTEGAQVMVTNASRVDGGAGRLNDRLAAVGFVMVAPGNYALGQLDVTKIYYDPANPAARAVADSLKAAFGGGAIEVLELTVPPPVDTGDVLGAGVLVAMANDIADKTLDELQGITPPATTAPASTAPADSTAATTPDTTGA